MKCPDGIMSPTFGMMVRALRMGFGWAHSQHAFVRISGSGPFLIECEPCGLVPNNRGRSDYHYCWWPNGQEDVRDVISKIQALKFVTRVKRAFSFYIDENGQTVRAA